MIGFNINASNYVVNIERKYFGKIPFEKIVEAVYGTVDTSGNIAIFPYSYAAKYINWRHNGDGKEVLGNLVYSKQCFPLFAAAIKDGRITNDMNNNRSGYRKYAENILRLKKEYGN